MGVVVFVVLRAFQCQNYCNIVTVWCEYNIHFTEILFAKLKMNKKFKTITVKTCTQLRTHPV